MHSCISQRALAQSETSTASSKTWTRIADSNSYDYNRYAKCASISLNKQQKLDERTTNQRSIMMTSSFLRKLGRIRYLQNMFDGEQNSSWTEKFIQWCHIYSWWIFWPMISKHCNTDGRTVRTARGTMLKNKPHLVIVHESILVSLWTFQLTILCLSALFFIKE